MTTTTSFFGVVEIYCKRRVKNCKECFDTKCKHRTEKSIRKYKRSIFKKV